MVSSRREIQWRQIQGRPERLSYDQPAGDPMPALARLAAVLAWLAEAEARSPPPGGAGAWRPRMVRFGDRPIARLGSSDEDLGP